MRISINYCFYLIMINFQVSMSLDRILAICFAMQYRIWKDKNYRTIMIVLSIGLGLIGGSALFVFYYYGHSPERREEFVYETWLRYSTIYSLWTVSCLLVIIICNGSILYSIKIRVRKRKTEIIKVFLFYIIFHRLDKIKISFPTQLQKQQSLVSSKRGRWRWPWSW